MKSNNRTLYQKKKKRKKIKDNRMLLPSDGLMYDPAAQDAQSKKSIQETHGKKQHAMMDQSQVGKAVKLAGSG